MGYLNKTQIVVDAILTKKGRELLSKGFSNLNITQFALADDEIDYGLWNPDNPDGTDYYGEAIENMPIVEASPDETQVMKYKLVTLPKGATRIPVVDVAISSTRLYNGQDIVIKPTTINFAQGNSSYGYTLILSNKNVATITVTEGIDFDSVPTIPVYMLDGNVESVSAIGKSFKLTAKGHPLFTQRATITIIGNETGGRKTVSITVGQLDIATMGIGNVMEAQANLVPNLYNKPF